jgi:hypothetical protein
MSNTLHENHDGESRAGRDKEIEFLIPTETPIHGFLSGLPAAYFS